MERKIDPSEERFTGFIFKIHANIDPRHRDRIAFMRICSGKFERNKFYQLVRTGKKMKFSNPSSFMARSKSTIDEAYPGDVVGLHDTGTFKIGDTLTDGETIHFRGIPNFSPEIFRELENMEPMRSKQLDKGIRQLTEEGVAQLFVQPYTNKKIVGTVGELQFEVIRYRLENEYGAKCRFQPLPFHKACWLTSEDEEQLREFVRKKSSYIAYDKEDNPVFLARSEFLLNDARQEYPAITFHTTSEFKTEATVGE